MTTKLTALEKETEKAIIELLVRRGFKVEKTDAGLIRRGTKKPRGMLSLGWPDLTAFHPSGNPLLPVCLLIEVKSERGELSARQKRMHLYLRAMGIEPKVVRSVEEVEALIERVKYEVKHLRWNAK